MAERWTKPTRTEWYDAIIDVIRLKWAELGLKVSTAVGSSADVDAETHTSIAMMLSRLIEKGVNFCFPDTTYGDGSARWAREVGLPDGQGGVGPIIERGGSAEDGLRVTASGGAVAPGALHGETLTDPAGNSYVHWGSHASIPDGTTLDVDIEAVDPGSETNLRVGTVLTFDSPPSNVAEEAEIVVALTGGVDDEEPDDINGRVCSVLSDPSLSGNGIHWRRWIEEAIPGTLDGWVWSKRLGDGVLGTVDYAATIRGAYRGNRTVSAAQQAIIDAAIAAEAPVTTRDQARPLSITETAVDIMGAIELHPGVAPDNKGDFDSKTLDASVSAYSEANKTITADKDITSASVDADQRVLVGDRVIIRSGQAVVTKAGTADGLASDAMIELDFWFDDLRTGQSVPNPWPWDASHNPTGDRITAGGGVVMGAHTAAIAYMARLGPTKGNYAVPELEDWISRYKPEGMWSAIERSSDAILGVEFDSGKGDSEMEGTDPLDATIPMLIPDEIVLEVDWS